MSERFEKLGLAPEDIEVLISLENLIHNSVEKVFEICMDTCGIEMEGNKIIGLGLFGCELSNFPIIITKLKSLKNLNLADNKLQSIPDSISELKLLSKLNLSLNDLKEIPETLGKLELLTKLNLEQNKIEKLPDSIGSLTNLKTLNLEENQFKHLPVSIGNLKSLRKLKCNNNLLETIPESIGNLTSLENLELINNNLNALPWTLWQLKNLKYLNLEENPWNDEWVELSKRDLASILDFCQKRASINVFLSHAVVDFEKFRIKEFSEYLENQNEIYKAFYCETDLKGNIDDFMNETVPKSQLLIFFASQKSVFDSVDCAHEIELARKHNIQILPIKGRDNEWEDLKTYDLDRLLGHEFEEDNFNEFCHKIYEYIKQFKRDVNLFEPEQAQFDKEKLNIKNIFNNFLESDEFKELLKENVNEFKSIFKEISNNQITMKQYLEKLYNLLLK